MIQKTNVTQQTEEGAAVSGQLETKIKQWYRDNGEK